MKKKLVIVDVDDTLAYSRPYLPLYHEGKIDEWEDSFPKHKPIYYIRDLVNKLYVEEDYYIVLMTARTNRKKTVDWLLENGVVWDKLHVGVLGDKFYWDIGHAKRELYEKLYADKYDLKLVIDDNSLVISEFDKLGVSTIMVNPQNT